MKENYSKQQDILTLLYYYFIKGIKWDKGMDDRYPEAISLIPLFEEKLRDLLGPPEKRDKDISGEYCEEISDEELYNLVTTGISTESKLLSFRYRMGTSLSFGLKVLNILNMEHALLSTPGQKKQKKAYRAITKLTAGKKLEEGEYIIKDYQFQNYSYSICREKRGLLRIEIYSTTGSLHKKKLQILIKTEKGNMEKLEAICNVITDIYVFYYHGEITEKTEILPIVSIVKEA